MAAAAKSHPDKDRFKSRIPSPEMQREVAAKILEFGDWLEKNVDQHKVPPEMRHRIAYALNYARKQFEVIGKQTNFLKYVKHMWPEFIEGKHHRIMADALQQVSDGKQKRLIVEAAPRSTKSEFCSVYLPTYHLGRFPHTKIMQFSNKKTLATKFGGQVKTRMDSKEYHAIFPSVWISRDVKSREAFETDFFGGRYVAMGVGAKAAGEGGDIIIIDDPHSEQDIIGGTKGSKDRWDQKWEWFNGIRQRLQPNGAIVIVATRWAPGDITGRCLQEHAKGLENWTKLSFPAIETDPETGEERSYFPEWKPLEELQKLRDQLPLWQWMAQYQQVPMSRGANTIRTEWWVKWDRRDAAGKYIVPPVTYKIQCWDTAYGKDKQRSDYSACTTWGVFQEAVFNKESGKTEMQNRLILIDAVRGRWEFPELKERCREQFKLHKPDVALVEVKASGYSLIQEMAQSGIILHPHAVSRVVGANDLGSRLHLVSDIFRQGMVYALTEERWAMDVVEETSTAPHGDHDDYATTVHMAVSRFRKLGFIRLGDDPAEEEDEDGEDRRSIRPAGYY